MTAQKMACIADDMTGLSLSEEHNSFTAVQVLRHPHNCLLGLHLSQPRNCLGLTDQGLSDRPADIGLRLADDLAKSPARGGGAERGGHGTFQSGKTIKAQGLC